MIRYLVMSSLRSLVQTIRLPANLLFWLFNKKKILPVEYSTRIILDVCGSIKRNWSFPKTDPGYFDLVTTHSIVHSIRLEYFFNQIFKLEISLVFPKLKLSNQLDQGLMSRQLDSGLNFRVTWSHWFRNCKFQISKRSQIIFRFWNSKFQDS